MKILHVGKFFHPSHGGIESFLMDIARESARQGVDQGIVAHAQKGQRTRDSDLAAFPYLRYFDRVPILGSFGYAPISPAFGHRLALAVKRFAPDLLYLHMPNPSAFWVLANRQAKRIPWIVHWHSDAAGAEFDRLVRVLYPFYRPFEQALLARAERVIVSSPPYLESSPALRRWHSRCHIVPLGLDPERIEPRGEQPAGCPWGKDETLRILAVGRLTPYKGFDVLIRAMRNTRARLIIAGSGSQRPVLEKLIGDLQLEQRVHLVGAVPDATRNWLLTGCDMICLPSLNRAEAFGISVLEAMALGKPALVSRVAGSGLPWLVEDGVTGWHVRPGDSGELTDRINWLDAHRSTIQETGERGRHRFREHFAIHGVTRKLIQLQEQTLTSNKTPET